MEAMMTSDVGGSRVHAVPVNACDRVRKPTSEVRAHEELRGEHPMEDGKKFNLLGKYMMSICGIVYIHYV